MLSKKLSRRKFLTASAAGIASVVFAACTSATPTTAPEAPTKEAPTSVGPTAEPTSIPTQAATATTVPTAAAIHEAPALAALVKAGKLPPLDQRLPSVPLTLSPVNTIGKYGGRVNIKNNYMGGYMEEGMYGYSPVRWIDDGQGIAQGLCDKWSTNADNSEWIVHMREGIKWSDGEPCTMADTMFWWNDLTIATDPNHPDGLPEWAHDANGVLVKLTQVDDYTLKLNYGTPAPLTLKQLAMWVKGCINGSVRWITPAHYIKQFHPKYNTAMTDYQLLMEKILFRQNPDCPSIDPWICTNFEVSKSLTWDRNPYYYAVDTQGNQLPYIDGWDEISVTDPQAELAQVLQGSVDFHNWLYNRLADYSTLKDNETKGNYDAFLLDSGTGTGMLHYYNHDHVDPKRRALYRNQKFRMAMSYALDRATIQEKVYYGTGILTTGTFSPKAYPWNVDEAGKAFYKKAREAYIEFNPEKSKTLLDEIGCKVGADGWRTFPDGSPLDVIIEVGATASDACLATLAISKPNFEAVGLKIILNTQPQADLDQKWYSGQGSIHTDWEWADGPDFLVYPDPGTPTTHERWAPLCGVCFLYSGTPQEFDEANTSPWDRKPPRFNKNDVDYKGTVYEKLHETYRKAIIEPDTVKRTQIEYDLWQIHIDNGPMFLGSVANIGHPMVVSKKLENVPRQNQYKLGGWVFPWILPNMAMTNPETYSFKA